MARKPQALARELLRNFPKRRARNARRRRKGSKNGSGRDANARAANSRRAAQAPGDAVLSRALSSGPGNAESNGGELAPGVGEKLQRNVDEALHHAEE
jgi:hypothetical protein